MTALLRPLAGGKMVMVLEGGYNLRTIRRAGPRRAACMSAAPPCQPCMAVRSIFHVIFQRPKPHTPSYELHAQKNQ